MRRVPLGDGHRLVGRRVLGRVTPCRLCGFERLAFICRDKRREFYLCDCGLASVPERYWLSADDEKVRYDLHDNALSNAGYVKFLSQVVEVAAGLSRPKARALDFGCGKEAALCRLLADRGIDCRGYDPLYGRPLPEASGHCLTDVDSDSRPFDIVILCEVVEHLRDIAGELKRVGRLLRDGGAVILRTQVYDVPSAFPNWWYAQDPTHINFFNRRSLEKAASVINKNLETTDYPDIFIFQ